VRELKACGTRPTDIAKVLKIGRASVYRVPAIERNPSKHCFEGLGSFTVVRRADRLGRPAGRAGCGDWDPGSAGPGCADQPAGLENERRGGTDGVGERHRNVMDEWADFAGVSGFALGAILLLMAAWGLAIVVIDRWVWAARLDLPLESSIKRRRAPARASGSPARYASNTDRDHRSSNPKKRPSRCWPLRAGLGMVESRLARQYHAAES
jgi:hypothetical protein